MILWSWTGIYVALVWMESGKWGGLKMPDVMILNASQQPFLSKAFTRTVGKSSESERPLMGGTGVGRQGPQDEAVKEQMADRQHTVSGMMEMSRLQLSDIVQGILAES
ncbi:hypothetical protein AFUB_097040 [Aspergillus fumigatus A1163]|uniref:Uncharacterized protein n=1 Tax=Aspergillus fumigatus (strain CBS 144.89 / FGSC A1163 / CEA10) TaxID=451804 RepID=B0YDW6_ASPFC|nr:hypothetical protein AFUB_097040 [Aspergillus fumigatus A1163]